MRLKDANIAQIENVDPMVQAEYFKYLKGVHGPNCAMVEKGNRTIENIMEGGEYEPS